MSLKNADKIFASLFPPVGSITHRLVISYSLLTLTVLILVSGLLYWILARNFTRENNQFLADQIHVLRKILKERPDDLDALRQEIEWEVVARSFEKYYARILDEQGQVLIETPGMAKIVVPSLFPEPIENGMPERAIKRKGREGQTLLLIAAWDEVGNSQTTKRLHQIALDISHEEAILSNYRRNMGIMLLVGTLFSVVIGAFIARKGLHPLQQIAKAAQGITATQLHERIAAAKWPEELTALATAFDEMLKRLQDSFTRLSQFSSDLAHELRTPINNLIGEAEVALSKTRAAAEYRQVIESSLEEFARLSRMIDGLLFLARAETADSPINKVSFEARQELETVREFHEAVATEQEIKVICEGKALINADPILFRRAMSNLLANALQYTPRGGAVILRAEKFDAQSITISVIDTGIGISPEHLPKIFDRFYRADLARSQYPQGTGLGLSIVKSIMELHHGSVCVTSEPSKGTKVTLCFPR